MSLAVSAVIAPSRRLRCLLAAFCASLCAASCAVGLVAPERFAAGGAVACALLLAAFASGRAALRAARPAPAPSARRASARCPAAFLVLSRAIFPTIATARRIDISGVGQIRLTVQQDLEDAGMPATLLPGAAVWPCCMLLRLRTEDGVVRPLVLLPDSVPPGQYRALAVAVRALGNGAMPSGTAGAPQASTGRQSSKIP